MKRQENDKKNVRKKGAADPKDLERGVSLVLTKKLSLRKAAEQCNVNYGTLNNWVKRKAANPDKQIVMAPNYEVKKVFTTAEEKAISEYLQKLNAMAYGLPPGELRKLAYKIAVANAKKIPIQWKKTEEAGAKWMRGFLKRNAELSIHKPEACSLSRLTSFNPHNVKLFYDNLGKIFKENKAVYGPSRIFNLDETATTTAQTPEKQIAQKGVKQVYKATSAQIGTLVTTCCFIAASGIALPPAMVFPRKFFKLHMLNGAPLNTLGLAAANGWSNEKLFLEIFDHFIKYSHSSKENPSLLICDNHASHLQLEVVQKAEEAGVTILTLPPHCSNKMQPLDVTVFKSFKTVYNKALEQWLFNHPGETVTIYQVAECVRKAFDQSMTISNITSGFEVTGIYPYNPQIFTEKDFNVSNVSDRPLEGGTEQQESTVTATEIQGSCHSKLTEEVGSGEVRKPLEEANTDGSFHISIRHC